MIRVVLASVVAALVALNDERKVVFQVKGPKFGLLDKAYREIGCGNEWCKVFGINNLGWVIGHGHNTYPVPPMGRRSDTRSCGQTSSYSTWTNQCDAASTSSIPYDLGIAGTSCFIPMAGRIC